jgi:hypothetical protein
MPEKPSTNVFAKLSLWAGLGTLGLTALYVVTRIELLLPLTTIGCIASIGMAVIGVAAVVFSESHGAVPALSGGLLGAICFFAGVPFG